MTTATAPRKVANLEGMAGSTVVKAMEKAYASLRKAHPDLPEVLFITGTGLMGRGAKWGHYGADRWVLRQDGTVTDEAGRLPEIFIAGERLACGATDTFATMVHEAVHALAVVRGVQDTSRGFRYHNQKFVALAEELGMEWPEGQSPDVSIGFSAVVLREDTIKKHAKVIEALDKAIHAHLDTFERLGLVTGKGGTKGNGENPDLPKTPKKPASRSNLKATCSCEEPRIIRASAAVLEAGGITCSECASDFKVEQ